MRRRLWDFLGKWLSRRGNANTMFALADKCHGWQCKGGPVMMKSTWPLSFRKSTVVASIRVRGGSPFCVDFKATIHLTFKLVCRKYPQKDEFRTKKILNQEFLYEISSFCTLSENNSLLHGNISCFCIFLAKNGVFNTNRTPRVADSNSPQWAMLSYLSIC